MTIEEQLSFLGKGTVDLIREEDLRAKLKKSAETGKPLRVKLGADPTAPDIHIGHTVVIRKLKAFQELGHTVIFLIGDFTGMIGDPSGKSAERNFISEEQIRHNLEGQKKQLEKFLDFGSGGNAAVIVNNYDWFKNISFLDFIRDVGKHITVNYMMAKDSVKKRLTGEDREGMSFTEFTYQLVQGYDFYYLWKHNGVKLQMGGSDQWGNIVTGTELIRRKDAGEAWALTTPLIKKADGTKFGKTESGNIWLDPKRTSPYDFYQFWFNAGDTDASTYIRIFTLKSKEEIEALEKEHAPDPGQRILQKALAADITARVHSPEILEAVLEATDLFFGKGSTINQIAALEEKRFLNVIFAAGIPVTEISRAELEQGIGAVEMLADRTKLIDSRGNAKKLMQGNGISVNMQKANNPQLVINTDQLINGKYILLQKGKKEFSLVKCV